jgi:hypothetical protein
MERFRTARREAPSHTALVLDAVRKNAAELPDLVRKRRPQGPGAGDLFPWRSEPGGAPAERKEHLRIRPLAGEWLVISQLAAWVSTELGDGGRYPGDLDVTRSEVVEAALDAYLT